MFHLLKKPDTDLYNTKKTLCTGCGFDLSGQHWNHCPRCRAPHPNGTGCGGCGNCNH